MGSGNARVIAATEVAHVIDDAIARLTISGKMGQSVLQPAIAAALRAAEFRADQEDTDQLLQKGMPVWRSKDDLKIVPTKRRRRVDIVVYKNDRLVAMIETESDLDDLRLSGVSSRNGHYDVYSIARNHAGKHFDSYNSVERMASAAYLWSVRRRTKNYPLPHEAIKLLEAIRSNDPIIHNPDQIPLFLVSGSCGRNDRNILAPRLDSLGAQLICACDA
jgi:hypothetical protein